MIVVKFGGSVLKDSSSLPKVYETISKEKTQELVVVVSAFYGVTDKLIECAYNAAKNIDISFQIIEQHQTIIKNSGLDISILDDLFGEFLKAIESIKIYKEVNAKILDYIMAFGERFSARVISAYLNLKGMRTRYFEGSEVGIRTNSDFGKAAPLPSTYLAVANFFRRVDFIPVVAGFIARDLNENYTTLGRNGSDYTAAIISYACLAECLKIYSDVDGILTGNPSFIKNAKAIDELSLSEYQELQYWLRRIHPHMLGSVIEKNIPLLLLNIDNPTFEGTKISYKSAKCRPKIIVFRDDAFFNTIEIPETSSFLQLLKVLINYFDENKIHPLWLDVKNTQVSTVICSSEKVSDLINTFSGQYIITTSADKVPVKIIGENIGGNIALVKDILRIARKYNVGMSFISHLAGSHSSVFIIEKNDNFLEFLNDLHDNIILQE